MIEKWSSYWGKQIGLLIDLTASLDVNLILLTESLEELNLVVVASFSRAISEPLVSVPVSH